jgi:outer membrane protein OmpA-like peptidoglycan-associated protein
MKQIPAIILLLIFAIVGFTNAQSVFDANSVTQSTEVYFASGQSSLTAISNASIDSIANFYKNNSTSNFIRITAHTDSVGSQSLNKVLSEKRAKSVREALVLRGIPYEKIETTAFGEKSPATKKQNEQGRQRNRRATLDVVVKNEMTTFAGQIKDKNSNKGIESTLIFTTKTALDSTKTDRNGFYSVNFPKNKEVEVDVFAEGYFFESQLVKIDDSNANFEPNFTLSPAFSGQIATIRELFFLPDAAILLERSTPELPKILRFVQMNPTLKFEIAGHSNYPNLPPEQLSSKDKQLSVNRAKTVYDYLLNNGIRADRISYKGYGNSEMRYPKGGTDAEIEENRRVEIRVK